MTDAQDSKSTQVPRDPGGAPRAQLKRFSGTWVAVFVALVILVFLLVFILQNLESVTVHFLGTTGHMPVAIAMLLAAVAGAALVALIGAARILQLRRATRKAHKAVR